MTEDQGLILATNIFMRRIAILRRLSGAIRQLQKEMARAQKRLRSELDFAAQVTAKPPRTRTRRA